MLSDAEVLCEFMEPRPTEKLAMGRSDLGWWVWTWKRVESSLPKHQRPVEYGWHPRTLTLNECREVEERLAENQRRHYCCLMFVWVCRDAVTMNPIEDLLTKNRFPLLHADAPIKIRALASVLRESVEEKRA